jgi:hypothetical protein
MDQDPLALSADAMRELGHRMVDRTIERMSVGSPGLGPVSRDETEARVAHLPRIRFPSTTSWPDSTRSRT